MLTKSRVFIFLGREVHGFHYSLKEFQKVKIHRASPTLSFQNKETEVPHSEGKTFPHGFTDSQRTLFTGSQSGVFPQLAGCLTSGRGVSTTTKY